MDARRKGIEVKGYKMRRHEDYPKYDIDTIIFDLIEIMQDAIELGHWNVDGSCDPSMAMDRAENCLKQRGFYGEPGNFLYDT